MLTQEQIKSNVEKLTKSNWWVDLVITGGGTGVFKELLQYGGGSSFLYRGYIPYSKEELYETYSIYKQHSAVSQETVNSILSHSFDECDSNCPEGKMPVTIVASSKLTYGGERPNRKHLCVFGLTTNNINKTYKFSPTKKTRVEQEEEVTNFILSTMFEILL